MEHSPLGTGGAIRHAEPYLRSENLLVVNGDSICEVDFRSFYGAHQHHHSLLSMVLSPVKNAQGYGTVLLDSTNRITAFREKASTPQSAWINAGMYLMNHTSLNLMPRQAAFSLEYDFFPGLVLRHPCYGFLVENEMLDIGTPERYEKAQQILIK